MSSMRNAVTRRPHKERSQPAARSKWGLLEKHKDYSLRAKDYNVKKQKLQQLERKARERHPDEFAFGMVRGSADGSGGLRQGKHGSGGTENVLSHDAVKLLKTQDAGYLRVAMAKNRKEMKRVREELGLGVRDGRGEKTVFEDDEKPELEQRLERGKKRDSDGVMFESEVTTEKTIPEELENEGVDTDEAEHNHTQKPRPKSKKQLLAEKDSLTRLRAERKKRRRLQEVRATKLNMLKRRQKEIFAAADELELQRAKMAKTIGGVNKNGVKFKIRERKR